MKLFLDTHTLIWFSIGDGRKLSSKAKQSIEKTNHDLYVSITSFWEISIKTALGKLRLEKSISMIAGFLNESGITLLPISVNDTIRLSNLEFHHRAPFDRMLVAQAMENDLTVISKDKNFSLYKVKTIW